MTGLRLSGETDESTSEEKPMIQDEVGPNRRRTYSHKSFPGVISVLVVSLVANALLLTWGSPLGPDKDAAVVKYTTRHVSPIAKDVPIKYNTVRFNSSLFTESVYRKDAGPEVDQAWVDLGSYYRTVVIPEDEGDAAGLAGHVKIRKSQGGGYLANVEALHHVHCLDMLRMSLGWNIDYYKDNKRGVFADEFEVAKLHVTHCLDALRQQVMCTADVDVLGNWWIDTSGARGVGREGESASYEGGGLTTFPDFTTEHKCRNFDDIRRWAEVRQAPLDSKTELRKGDTVLDDWP